MRWRTLITLIVVIAILVGRIRLMAWRYYLSDGAPNRTLARIDPPKGEHLNAAGEWVSVPTLTSIQRDMNWKEITPERAAEIEKAQLGQRS